MTTRPFLWLCAVLAALLAGQVQAQDSPTTYLPQKVPARTFALPGVGIDVHFANEVLTICPIGDPTRCTSGDFHVTDVVPLDDNWYFVILDAHNYYACTLNWCEPFSTDDKDRGWVGQNFEFTSDCFYSTVPEDTRLGGLNCTKATKFRKPTDLIFGAFSGPTPKVQIYSPVLGKVCDPNGGVCRDMLGPDLRPLTILSGATRISPMEMQALRVTGIVAVNATQQITCRRSSFQSSGPMIFSCFTNSATDVADLEPYVFGDTVIYAPRDGITSGMLHPDANGNPQPTDNVVLANQLNRSFTLLNQTNLGVPIILGDEPSLVTIDIPALVPDTPPPSGWTKIADEGQGFTITSPQTVRYGAGSSWITLNVNGDGTCSNAYFGNDPLPGVVKECDVSGSTPPPPPPPGWTKIADEGQGFNVTGTQTVRYGTGSTFITLNVTSSGTCSNVYFGNDPVPGIVKECDVQAAAATPPTWTPIAIEGQDFTVNGTRNVRYGSGSNWITLSVANAGSCTNAYFGNDPIYGVAKECDVQSATANNIKPANAVVDSGAGIKPIPAGTPTTIKVFTDKLTGSWPTVDHFEECVMPPGAVAVDCGEGDTRELAIAALVGRVWPRCIHYDWVKESQTTGKLTLTFVPPCNPGPPLTLSTNGARTQIPMTVGQCTARCGQNATVEENNCVITGTQIIGATTGLGIGAGIVVGTEATLTLGPEVGIPAGVKMGGVFIAATAPLGVAYGAVCVNLSKERQNRCLVNTCKVTP